MKHKAISLKDADLSPPIPGIQKSVFVLK